MRLSRILLFVLHNHDSHQGHQFPGIMTGDNPETMSHILSIQSSKARGLRNREKQLWILTRLWSKAEKSNSRQFLLATILTAAEKTNQKKGNDIIYGGSQNERFSWLWRIPHVGHVSLGV